MRIAFKKAVFLVVSCMFVGCRYSAATPLTAHGSDLRSVIENEIRSHVRESWGEYVGENFSDADLKRFEADRVPAQIVSELKDDKLFFPGCGECAGDGAGRAGNVSEALSRMAAADMG